MINVAEYNYIPLSPWGVNSQIKTQVWYRFPPKWTQEQFVYNHVITFHPAVATEWPSKVRMWFNGFNGKQRQLWAQVCCFYFEGEPILSGWTLGSLTELPHRGEEGNPCFYFSFQTARVELKNKLEPGGPSVNSCANVLVWCEGTEGLRLERPDLPYFSIVEKKKKKTEKGRALPRKKKHDHLEIKLCVSECALYAQGAPWNFEMLDQLACIVARVSGFISFVCVSSSELTVTMCRG